MCSTFVRRLSCVKRYIGHLSEGTTVLNKLSTVGITLMCVLAPFASQTYASNPLIIQPTVRPTTKSVSCLTGGCHSDVTSRKVMHAPVAQSKCLDCHEYALPREHLFVLSKPSNELCIDCHKPNRLDRIIHQPVAEGNCMGCHDPHGSDYPTFLIKDPAKDLCLTCHQDEYSKHEFVHGPVAVGACIVCHESHSSSFKSLLSDRSDRLCLNCHDELRPNAMEKRNLHKPMKDGCIACHNPHASDAKFQLEQSVPNLCLKCHDWFNELYETSAVIHSPTQAQSGCTQCHNPHFSVLPKLQKLPQPELCFKCHDKPVKASDGRILTDMKTFLEQNPDHHGPIREGACTMCHHPHASTEQNLLIQAYPPEFYAPFSVQQYELCFTCHQPDLVKDKQGTGLTRFRDGDQNLHWLHVNREKGRTCRACHEVHASKKPAHIRESVPFGSSGWMLDINFEKAPEGGSCAPGCHKKKTYSRALNAISIDQAGVSYITNPDKDQGQIEASQNDK